MAKEKKSKKSEKVEAKAEKAAEREFKYGVEDIAEALDIKPASVRVQLRNKEIEKAGKSYGWNSKAELQEVIDALKSSDEKPAKKAKTKGKAAAASDDDEDEKPAKGKKADKKAKGKKSKKDEDDD